MSLAGSDRLSFCAMTLPGRLRLGSPALVSVTTAWTKTRLKMSVNSLIDSFNYGTNLIRVCQAHRE